MGLQNKNSQQVIVMSCTCLEHHVVIIPQFNSNLHKIDRFVFLHITQGTLTNRQKENLYSFVSFTGEVVSFVVLAKKNS